jgi:TP901 family phage tail tape measure protein
MGAGRVRQGQVYVEIGADPAKFFAALNKVNRRIAGLGRELSNVGAGVAGAGLSLAAPFVAGVAAAATFQDAILAVQASTGATAGDLDRVREAAMQMSASLSVGPTEAAQGMLELLKAGMSLEAVLGGAGEAAIQFAKVGGLDVGKAAVVMSDAMNVFGVSASVAANTISAAADASSTSIEQMAESFSMSSAVAALANQSISDLSAALAILANNGIKGSDAGTSVKTMLMRLMAPADEAVGALQSVGLSVASFRNADGSMKPLVDIIGSLTTAMAGLDQAAKDDLLRRVFGQDAIRAAAILTSAGVEGFAAMQDGMADALPVSEKYKQIMSGLSGAAAALSAAMQRLGIAIGEAVGDSIMAVMPPILGFINAITDFARSNAAMVGTLGKAAAVAIVAGGALTSLGLSLKVASFAAGGLLGALSMVLAPFRLAVGAAFALAGGAASAAVSIGRMAVAMGSQLAAAAAASGAGIASAVAGVVRYIAATVAAAAATVANAAKVGAAWVVSALPGLAAFLAAALSVFGSYAIAAAGVVAASVASAAAATAAWLAPAAPVIAIVAAIGVAAAAALAFGDSIKSAMGGVGEAVSSAASYIGTGFNQAVADGAVVFGDLYRTATTTFSGIYDALSAGDLSGAMDILWAGLVAGWLRGQEAIMGFIDPWISTVQNLFTDLGTGIAIIWDRLWTSLATTTIGAAILGIFDNIAVGVMAIWDTLVAEIQKAWIRVQGLISGAKDTKERVAQIDNEKQARAEQRRQSMPGVNERVRRANEEGDQMREDARQRQDAIAQGGQEIKDGRNQANADRAAERRAATVAAEKDLEGKTKAAGDRRSAVDLEQEIAQVSDMEGLHELSARFHELAATGNLTQEQMDKMRESLGEAQERLEETGTNATGDSDAEKAEENAASAGADVEKSKSETVGTFSAMAADRMGFGSSIQDRIAKASEETAKNTRGMKPATVGS